jgi:hypothetical protein
MQATALTSRESARAEILAELDAQLHDLELARQGLRSTLLGSGFVVTCEGLTIDYWIEPSTRIVKTKGTAPCYMARRFTRRDAERIAAITINGNGKAGTAIHVRDAIERDIAAITSLRATLASV